MTFAAATAAHIDFIILQITSSSSNQQQYRALAKSRNLLWPNILLVYMHAFEKRPFTHSHIHQAICYLVRWWFQVVGRDHPHCTINASPTYIQCVYMFGMLHMHHCVIPGVLILFHCFVWFSEGNFGFHIIVHCELRSCHRAADAHTRCINAQ